MDLRSELLEEIFNYIFVALVFFNGSTRKKPDFDFCVSIFSKGVKFRIFSCISARKMTYAYQEFERSVRADQK